MKRTAFALRYVVGVKGEKEVREVKRKCVNREGQTSLMSQFVQT
jgi:hypothetical protein